MTINPGKYNSVSMGKNSNDDSTSSFNGYTLKYSKVEKVSGMKIDKKSTFKIHIKTLWT